MSQVIRLNGTDYLNILTWFELAFAKVGKGEMKDEETKNKICQMAQAHQEEQGMFKK